MQIQTLFFTKGFHFMKVRLQGGGGRPLIAFGTQFHYTVTRSGVAWVGVLLGNALPMPL